MNLKLAIKLVFWRVARTAGRAGNSSSPNVGRLHVGERRKDEKSETIWWRGDHEFVVIIQIMEKK